MNESQYLSTAQVADALGVSITTIKRWVDEGILPAHKTAGGHRKLLLADVLRVAREGQFPRLDLTRLQQATTMPDPKVLRPELRGALRSGDAVRIRSLLGGAYQAGLGLGTLADEVIAPAINQLGHDWEVGRLDVMHEHRATQMCLAALFELKAVLETQVEKKRPVAVGGAPEHDYYLLPTLLAQLILLDAGWEAINLGPHTPLISFSKAIDEHRPRLIWVSASHIDDVPVFLRGFASLYSQAEKAGVAVVVGGRALTEYIRKEITYTTFGDHLSVLAAFARTLCPHPRQPRRGRPPLEVDGG